MYEEIFERLSPCSCGCTPQIAIDNKRNSVAVVCEHCRYEARAENAEKAVELWEHVISVPELRYNSYHDPTTGRFTGPGGGYLFVGKGQKGKGSYVFETNKGEDFDDDEYEQWKSSKNIQETHGGIPKRFVNNTGWYAQSMIDDYNKIENKVNKTNNSNVLLKYRNHAIAKQNIIKKQIDAYDYSRDTTINTVKLRQFDRKYDSLIKMIDEKMEARPWMKKSDNRAFDDDEEESG